MSDPLPTGEPTRALDESFGAAILAWADGARRDLPWRRTRDGWSVLVSELMLQQTQVARVVDRYPAFLQRFPDASTCAAAPAASVIDAWAGLGYNRRALYLHQAATAVVERHGGVLPGDIDALLALPGVGPYTARAVLAFAFEHDVAVVDVNVGRLLARWYGAPVAPREAQRAADALVPRGQGWRWNQAVLDLGATVCRARGPRCEACPARPWCGWRGAGPDPAVGSAGSGGRQSAFAGSDRQGRGRLIDALRRGPVTAEGVASVMGWPEDPDRARSVAGRVVADGLARRDGDGVLSLPT